MRQNYKVFLTSIIIATLIIVSGLLLFGTLDATEPTDCEPLQTYPGCPKDNLKQECPQAKPAVPSQPCPPDATNKQGNYNALRGGKS